MAIGTTQKNTGTKVDTGTMSKGLSDTRQKKEINEKSKGLWHKRTGNVN